MPPEGITSHSDNYCSCYVLNITSFLFPSDGIYLGGWMCMSSGEYERAWVILFNRCYFNVLFFDLKHNVSDTDVDLSAFKQFIGLK